MATTPSAQHDTFSCNPTDICSRRNEQLQPWPVSYTPTQFQPWLVSHTLTQFQPWPEPQQHRASKYNNTTQSSAALGSLMGLPSNTDNYKYTIIAVDEFKTNTIASVNSIVCPEGFHYWMVFILGHMDSFLLP